MKRWCIWIVAVVLLLAGCVEKVPEESTQPTETTQPDPGLYDPGSAVVQQTNGAVRAYPLEMQGCSGMDFMGSDVLVFFNENETTTVTRLTEDNCVEAATVQLPLSLYPDDSTTRTAGRTMAYYSYQDNAVVYLNDELQESKRISLPDTPVGTPVLGDNLYLAYYCTEGEIRVAELKTGISRMIRQYGTQQYTVCRSVLGDTVLQCFALEADGSSCTAFISAETGTTLGVDKTLYDLHTWEKSYFLHRGDGAATEYLFGTKDGEPESMLPQIEGELYSALSMGGVVSASVSEEGGISLSFFDLESGSRTSRVTLASLDQVYAVSADANGDYIWFLSGNDQGGQTLYRWDVAKSPIEDPMDYTGIRYTLENPDEEGLEQCRSRAKELGQQFGVSIYLVDAVKQPTDYSLIYEHQVTTIQKGLTALEESLAKLPEGFLKKLGRINDSGKLRIGLVRSIEGTGLNTLEAPEALQYWVSGNAYMALTVNDSMGSSFLHELSHVLDSYIFAESVLYDEWDQLNPEGFQYDGNYTDYLLREESDYLEPEGRCFIDAYSMTYAKEDRARILEYAMAEGTGEYFTSTVMQNKLLRVCRAIRDAFRWEKDTRVFPWEQYLTEPLAYSE